MNVKQRIDRMGELKQLISVSDEEYKQHRDVIIKELDKTASGTISSKKYSATCRKSLLIEYDLQALDKKALDPNIKKQIIEREVVVVDYEGLVNLLKNAGVKPSEFKSLIEVRRSVNKDKIKELFDTNQLSLDDIEGCYTAQIKKSVYIS